MLDILLVRHAHTYGNAQRKIGYSWETDKLDMLWFEQIPPLWKKLWDRIFSLLQERDRRVVLHRSDTNRTRQTLELSLWGLSGIEYELKIPHQDIGEIDMWDMTWKPIDIEVFRGVLSSVHRRFPNWECRKDVWNRMKRYMRSLEGNTIHVIFSHGVAISSIVHEILWDYDEKIRLANASMSHLRMDWSGSHEILSLGE